MLIGSPHLQPAYQQPGLSLNEAIQEAFALLLSSFQSGFRKGRSTIDALVRVSNDVEKPLKMKEIRAIVYFDIEKAYDSMWRDGLLIKLSRMGIGGRM